MSAVGPETGAAVEADAGATGGGPVAIAEHSEPHGAPCTDGGGTEGVAELGTPP